jgi:hypothetical protein
MQTSPEPWLRGSIPGLDPLLAPVLYAFQQAREDLAYFTEGLSTQEIWLTPHGFASVGFHIVHITGSTDRLVTYLEGRQISDPQLAALGREGEPGAAREQLLADLDVVFRRAELVIRALDPARLSEPREVGRKRLPTTGIGLLTHIAEHTQRHLGQAISTSKWARTAQLSSS